MLVLWDIDQTLIDAGTFDREIWSQVCADLVGVPAQPVDTIPGQTIGQILRDVLTGYGATAESAKRLLPQALASERDRICGDNNLAARGQLLPGAAATLRGVASTPGVAQSVLTGNQRESAAAKLTAFGVAGFLDLDAGAYGSDREDRHQLVPLARQRARARYGGRSFEPTVLVGDSLLDIAAARRNDAAVIAVATGRTDTDQLSAAGADAVLPHLKDTDGFLAILRELDHGST